MLYFLNQIYLPTNTQMFILHLLCLISDLLTTLTLLFQNMDRKKAGGGDNFDLSLTGSQISSARSAKPTQKRPSSSGGRPKTNNSTTPQVNHRAVCTCVERLIGVNSPVL